MKNNKHTAGPWSVDCTSVAPTINSIDKTICQIHEPTMGHLKHVNVANARLIASAPEMLEALEHLSNELCEGEFVKHSADAIRKIKSAIAKARGEA